MTLMEAVVALVILSLVAIGCLELSQGASNLEYSATQWNAAVTMAESRMAQATAGAPASMPAATGPHRASPSDSAMQAGVHLTRETWRNGLDVLTVTVPVTGAKSYVLKRVVPSVPPGAGLAVR